MSNRIARAAGRALSARVSPAAVVISVASLFVLGGLVVRLTGAEAVDARVTLEGRAREARRRPASRARPVSFGEGDPSVRYSDRLREASALTLGFSLYVLHERIVGRRVVPTAGAALEGARRSSLMPPRMEITDGAGVVASPAGLYYIRYRPEPFGVEVLSVGARGFDSGDVFVVRVPETSHAPAEVSAGDDHAAGYATILTAPYRDAPVPKPFAPVEQFAAAGWSRQPLRATPFNARHVAELRAWLPRRSGDVARGGE